MPLTLADAGGRYDDGHSIESSASVGTYLSGTREHRVLAVRIDTVPAGVLRSSGAWVTKGTANAFRTSHGTTWREWPETSQLAYPNALVSPPGFDIGTFDASPLFGRALAGTWEVSLTRPGSSQPLPELSQLELEFLIVQAR